MKITKIFMVMMFIFILLSSSAYPYQVKSHIWVTEQAIKIICEKHPEYKPILEQYRNKILQGIAEADTKPEKNIPDTYSDKHFQDPWTHRGIRDTSAGKICRIYIEAAAKAWQKGDKEKCFYLLGVSLHFVEDTSGITLHSNPMVMGNIPTNGFHGKYEAYMGSLIEDHPERYLTNGIIDVSQIVSFKKGGKTHCDPNSPDGWVDYGAHQSNPYYERVKNGDKNEFDAVALETIPLSEKLAAGAIYNFLSKLDLTSELNQMTVYNFVETEHQVGDSIYYFKGIHGENLIGEGRIEEIGEYYNHPQLRRALVKILWSMDELVFEKDCVTHTMDLYTGGYYIIRKPNNPYRP